MTTQTLASVLDAHAADLRANTERTIARTKKTRSWVLIPDIPRTPAQELREETARQSILASKRRNEMIAELRKHLEAAQDS